jgi:hypothetical protein
MELSILVLVILLDYVACNFDGGDKKNDIDIINGVKRIKGTKFNAPQLSQFLKMLKKYQYLS